VSGGGSHRCQTVLTGLAPLQKSSWRKGSFLNPFCHLVIKAVRVDSPPYQNSPQTLAELLTKYRLKSNLSSDVLAAKLGVSLGTFKNWEHGLTKPSKKIWPALKLLEKCLRGNPTLSFST
jgi:DNA-binding transcriptional regulator YiaG